MKDDILGWFCEKILPFQCNFNTDLLINVSKCHCFYFAVLCCYSNNSNNSVILIKRLHSVHKTAVLQTSYRAINTLFHLKIFPKPDET